MKKNDHEQNQHLFNLKRKSKDEVLEWSPTGYGFIAATPQNEAETDSENDSCEG